jgi:MoxR-like ATPase
VAGVPGLAKSLVIRSIAEAMRLDFRRIQFTPDLVPSDITRTAILEEDTAAGVRPVRFVRGPVRPPRGGAGGHPPGGAPGAS